MLEIYREHHHRTKQIFLLARTELLKTYKGAFLGTGWAVVKPIFTLFVYWFAFSVGLSSSKNIIAHAIGGSVEVPRFWFMLAGFVPWCFISDAILFGSRSIRSNRQFVIKMAFPVSTIMTFTLLSKLFVHLGLMIPTLIYFFCVGNFLSVHALQFFLFMPLMFIFFLFVSWSTAPMSAFSLDFENFINSIMTGLFWLSGIMWDVNGAKLPASLHWFKWVLRANPINFLVDGYRCAFIYHKWFWEMECGWQTAVIFLAEMIFFAFFGVYNYKRLRKKLPDVL